MNLCSSSKHVEVCYESDTCPACGAYQTGYDIGFNNGFKDGNLSGYNEGYIEGKNQNE